ncbi:hypothetical protein [Halopiger goleimassiliensis]|uniref:hypothetical protein n=1 Tax=Halopiger goleimassiliensis TaxID=1293048 RepID=UPI000AF90491|nr:hypothetical protein [Halopiger goleimassiliensis]
MAIADRQSKTVVRCGSCGTMFGAAIEPDGSVVPLGTRDVCPCGNDGNFDRLR